VFRASARAPAWAASRRTTWNTVAADILGSEGEAEKAKRDWLFYYKPMRTASLAQDTQGETNAQQMSAHAYWQLYLCRDFPELGNLALRVLAMPVAASACEGIWSVFQYMQRDKRRSSLKSEDLRLQVFVSANRKLERKKSKGLWKSQNTKWVDEEEEIGEAREIVEIDTST